MYRKFLLPLLIMLYAVVSFGQQHKGEVSASPSVKIKADSASATIIINDYSALSGALKSLTMKELNMDELMLGNIIMAIDTPGLDSLDIEVPDAGEEDEEIEIITNDSADGDFVEIIIRDKTGTKKTIKIDKSTAKNYKLDMEDGEMKLVEKKRGGFKKVESEWFALDLGFNGLLYKGSASFPSSLSNLELDPLRSVHVNVGIFQQKFSLYKGYVNFIYGINYDNNDYRFSNDINLKVNDSLGMISYDSRNTVGFDRNKLTTRFLSIPLSLRFDTKPQHRRQSFHFTVGMNVGYRLTSFFKTVRQDEGKRKNKVYDDFLLNNFRYGAFAKVGYGNVSLFASYIFTPLFRENAGPELNTYSFGLALGKF